MYQLQNIDYLYRISTMTGSSKLVTVQADRDSHDLNDKHFVMLNLCRAIVNFANEGHVISAVYELEPDGTSKRVAYRGLPEYQEALLSFLLFRAGMLPTVFNAIKTRYQTEVQRHPAANSSSHGKSSCQRLHDFAECSTKAAISALCSCRQ